MGATLQIHNNDGTLTGVGLVTTGGEEFIVGVTEPRPSNSGVQSTAVLTDYPDKDTARTVLITSPGTVIENYNMGNVRLDIRTYDVLIRNCEWIVTDNATAVSMIRLDQAPNIANCRIEHVTIDNRDQMGFNYNAIQGHDYTAYRCKVLGTVDGLRPNRGGNVHLIANFVGALGWWGTATGLQTLNSGFQTHSDCVQTTFGTVEMIGNSFWGYPSTIVGTGTPGNGTDTGNPAGWYTQAESNARRAASFTTMTNPAKSPDGIAHELGGIVTPLMCNWDPTQGTSDLNLKVHDNWFAGGLLHVNAFADNITSPLGTFRRNKHYNDALNKVSGKSMCYAMSATLVDDTNGNIPLSGPDINYYLDGTPGIALIQQES